jgi:transcriptional regulator with XRE-family HTH domain
MTPFGDRMRKLRAERNMTLKDMAGAVGVSPAYLSALEHGKRGRPSWHLIQRIIAHFNIIWDEAEEVVHLAQIGKLDQATLEDIMALVDRRRAKSSVKG